MAAHRARKSKLIPVSVGDLQSVPEPVPVPVREPEKTDLQHFVEMLERSNIEHKATLTDTSTIVRIGDRYSYSLWSFELDGLLKGQAQYESNE